MSRFQTLKFFVKIMNSSSMDVLVRQRFLTASCYCQISKLCCHTSSKVVTPDNSKMIRSAIDPAEELDLSDYGSVLMPSFNFAAYADKSPLLQELLKIGVDLFEIEKKPRVEYILTLKWENIQKYLSFLTDNGVPSEKLGNFITLNPFIFKENLEDLQIRINYLESKKFDKDMISNILVKNPKWLSLPVKVIDKRLGVLQESFDFKGDHIREIISRSPALGTVATKKLLLNIYTLKEDLHLDANAARNLVLSEPKLLTKDPYDLLLTYDYLTETMNVSLDLILKQPKILTTRKFLIKERHLFLKALGRAQYNHMLPGYVSLLELIDTTDEDFCKKVAKASLKCYDEFLKTL